MDLTPIITGPTIMIGPVMMNDVEAISKIKAQAIRMSKLVTEISEAAIVDNDLVTKKRERVDLSNVIKEIVDHYVDGNEFSKLKITSSVQAKVFVNGLPDRLGQVVVNLLDLTFPTQTYQ